MGKFTTTEFDKKLLETYDYVLGIDEVGRGCIAGDIVACGFLVSRTNIDKLNERVADSKTLSAKRRELVAPQLAEEFQHWVAARNAQFINAHGIGKANIEIFEDIIKAAKEFVEERSATLKIVVDGTDGRSPKDTLTLPKAESTSTAVAAASIVAKQSRDKAMEALHAQHPNYGFDAHKGYGTAQHKQALIAHGLLPEHRTLFTRTFLR